MTAPLERQEAWSAGRAEGLAEAADRLRHEAHEWATHPRHLPVEEVRTMVSTLERIADDLDPRSTP